MAADGDAVEANKLELVTRRFTPRPPIWTEGPARRLVHRFKLSIFGSAKVIEVLDGAAPEVEGSRRELGAEISGETISGQAGRLGKAELVNATGGHKGQRIAASKHATARVDIPLRQEVTARVLGRVDKDQLTG